MSSKRVAKKKVRKRKAKTDAVAYLYDRYIADDPERLASVAEEEANLDIAQKIYDLRTAAALSMPQIRSTVAPVR